VPTRLLRRGPASRGDRVGDAGDAGDERSAVRGSGTAGERLLRPRAGLVPPLSPSARDSRPRPALR